MAEAEVPAQMSWRISRRMRMCDQLRESHLIGEELVYRRGFECVATAIQAVARLLNGVQMCEVAQMMYLRMYFHHHSRSAQPLLTGKGERGRNSSDERGVSY